MVRQNSPFELPLLGTSVLVLRRKSPQLPRFSSILTERATPGPKSGNAECGVELAPGSRPSRVSTWGLSCRRPPALRPAAATVRYSLAHAQYQADRGLRRHRSSRLGSA